MLPNSKFPADLVTFTEEIRNGKFHFLCSAQYQSMGKGWELILPPGKRFYNSHKL